MNFIKFESAQKLRGGFYTEPAIASFLARWVKTSKPKSILEPSCGDGSFLHAIQDARVTSLKMITACELDAEAAEKAASRTSLPVKVHKTDFLRWYLLFAQNEERFDAVLGNPPFIRYQYLPSEQQLLAEKIFNQLKLPFTKHTNAWVPFVLASLHLLRPGGRIAMVVPSEIFHIPHAQSLRRYLLEQCSRILIIDPQELWFADALQGTVLLMAEKKIKTSEETQGVAILPVKSSDALTRNPEEYFQNATYTAGPAIESKWMPLFLSLHERSLLSGLRFHDNIKKFAEVASVDVGIVTGANKYFLVPDEIVARFSLQKWAYPMFGRSDHINGLIYSTTDHQINKKIGLPTNFLWFNEKDIRSLPANVKSYLEVGLSQNLHTRFKCRTRDPWYKVPSVYSTPIAMLKRAHHFPRLVLNCAEAYSTDTAYRIQPSGVNAETLVLNFVNSLTCLTAELEGRHYGGGVLELVPSEIERLLVPVTQTTIIELKAADKRFRNASNDPDFLLMQDTIILGKLGINREERDMLHGAWEKLRNRRHRISSGIPAEFAPEISDLPSRVKVL